MKKYDKLNMGKTFKEGLGGGILGGFLGVPALGAMAGMIHANKNNIKMFSENINNNNNKIKIKKEMTGPHGKGVGPGLGQQSCKQQDKKRKSAWDNPSEYFL